MVLMAANISEAQALQTPLLLSVCVSVCAE